jgi:hypothetical protein
MRMTFQNLVQSQNGPLKKISVMYVRKVIEWNWLQIILSWLEFWVHTKFDDFLASQTNMGLCGSIEAVWQIMEYQ